MNNSPPPSAEQQSPPPVSHPQAAGAATTRSAATFRRSLPRRRGIAAALLIGLLLTITGAWLPAHLQLQQGLRWGSKLTSTNANKPDTTLYAETELFYKYTEELPPKLRDNELTWPDRAASLSSELWPKQPAKHQISRGIGYGSIEAARTIIRVQKPAGAVLSESHLILAQSRGRPLTISFNTFSQSAVRFGFPLPFLRRTTTSSTFPDHSLTPMFFWEKSWVEGLKLPLLGYLPIRPDWIPFLFNWAGFTLLVFLIIMLLRWKHIRKRGRRGLCAACGYQLAGLPRCPECGL